MYYSSSAGQPVLCGVSRIWVLADYRRAGVASSLVDCMRASFFQATPRNIASKERLLNYPSTRRSIFRFTCVSSLLAAAM